MHVTAVIRNTRNTPGSKTSLCEKTIFVIRDLLISPEIMKESLLPLFVLYFIFVLALELILEMVEDAL